MSTLASLYSPEVHDAVRKAFEICVGSPMPMMESGVEMFDQIKCSSGPIEQPMKMFKEMTVVSRFFENKSEEILATCRLSYYWELYDGGTNGTDILTLFVMADGKFKFRNNLCNNKDVQDLEI